MSINGIISVNFIGLIGGEVNPTEENGFDLMKQCRTITIGNSHQKD